MFPTPVALKTPAPANKLPSILRVALVLFVHCEDPFFSVKLPLISTVPRLITLVFFCILVSPLFRVKIVPVVMVIASLKTTLPVLFIWPIPDIVAPFFLIFNFFPPITVPLLVKNWISKSWLSQFNNPLLIKVVVLSFLLIRSIPEALMVIVFEIFPLSKLTSWLIIAISFFPGLFPSQVALSLQFPGCTEVLVAVNPRIEIKRNIRKLKYFRYVIMLGFIGFIE